MDTTADVEGVIRGVVLGRRSCTLVVHNVPNAINLADVDHICQSAGCTISRVVRVCSSVKSEGMNYFYHYCQSC